MQFYRLHRMYIFISGSFLSTLCSWDPCMLGVAIDSWFLFFCRILLHARAKIWHFSSGSMVKKICLPMQKTQVWLLSREEPLEKKMAGHSSILAWEILWSEEPGGLQSKGLQKVRRDLEAKQQGIIYKILSIQLSTGYLVCFRLGWLWKLHEHSLSLSLLNFTWAVLGLCCCQWLSLAALSQGYFPVAGCGLLVSVATFVVEQGLRAYRLQ